MITPREMLRDYMTVLNILMQNEDVTFEQVIAGAFGDSGAFETHEEKDTPTQAGAFTAEDIEF